MPRQLVGSLCVRCQRKVSSILEGEFCAACGNPVHERCKSSGDPEAGTCAVCGGPFTSRVAVEIRKERTQEAQKALQGNYPVSPVCPACKSTEFTTVRPKRWIAFLYDRVCRSCGTTYIPPTPVWASIVFTVAGALLACYGTFAVLIAHSLFEAPLAILGFLAIWQGVRGLAAPGKV